MNFLVEFILAACARNIYRIIACEAALAVAEAVVYKLSETFNGQIRKAVSAYVLRYFLGSTALACNEIFL